MTRLDNAVALVTGASRGAGRGIALELGGAGATVYVTGRSVAGGPTTDNVPGTIDESAQAVTSRGGMALLSDATTPMTGKSKRFSTASVSITDGSTFS